MFSTRIRGRLPKHRKERAMSYTFGPHMQAAPLYFGGDGRVVEQNPSEIPLATSDPPAWLVADWLVAKSKGQPLSPFATACIEQRDAWNRNLHWLAQVLHQ